MSTIILKNNKGFQWFSNKTIFIKGCFFDSKNNYYEKENLISFFTNINNQEQFIKKVKEINGIFTVLIKLYNKTLIASDTTRIFPLFYTFKNAELNISDNIEYLKDKFNIQEIDKNSSNEFLASGYTLGNKTLLKTIYTLQSNEYIIFEKSTIIKQGFFFSYSAKKINNSEYSELKKQSIKAFENSFSRLIKSLNNKTAVIPLSGGFDSRLIAVMFKKHNYTNVVCYTYGKKGNSEVEISKKIAETLNFKWFFIEYKNTLIEGFLRSDDFIKYTHYVGKFTSMPFLQEYFAVKHLSDNNLISKDAIFIPGHSGDLLGGSQFEKVIPNNLKTSQIPNLILKEKFNLNKNSIKKNKNLHKSIENLILHFDLNYTAKIPSSIFENYDIKEKISKFIFNSSCIYSFYNYEFRFPYWDKQLLMFFKDVPIKYKKGKFLYDDILINNYFETFSLNFNKELQPSLKKIYIQKFKNKLKPFVPNFILKKFLQKNDWLNSEMITMEMKNSLKKNNLTYNSKITTYNEINIQWYLYFCKGLIKK